MARIISIKDLMFNYDYGLILEKNFLKNEVQEAALKSFESILLKAKNEAVTGVLLVGDLFDEAKLLIDEIEQLMSIIKDYESIEFIIAPPSDIDETSWYYIINWPGNCSLITKERNYFESHKQQIVFYQGEIDNTLQSSEYLKLPMVNKWNDKLEPYLPLDFTEHKKGCYVTFDSSKDEAKSNYGDTVKLVVCKVTLTPDDDIHAIVEKVNHQCQPNPLTFYKVELEGTVNDDVSSDLINMIKDHLSSDMDVIISDNTYKDYNIDQIHEENKENLIGIFINNVLQNEKVDDKRKIIETGLDYLL